MVSCVALTEEFDALASFIAGILFQLSSRAGFTGMAYGFSSGRYRSDNDVIEGLTKPIKLLGVYFVGCSLLPRCLPVSVFSSGQVSLRLWERTCFLLLSRLLCPHSSCLSCLRHLSIWLWYPPLPNGHLCLSSSSRCLRRWDFAGRHVVCFSYRRQFDECHYSFLILYAGWVLTYMRQYDKQITYGSLLKYTWRYSLCILSNMDIKIYRMVSVEDIPMGY